MMSSARFTAWPWAVVLPVLAMLTGCRAAQTPEAATRIHAGTASAAPTVVDNCDHQAEAVLGKGYKEFASEEDMRRQMAGHMFFPDPATLPLGSRFVKGYHNASDAEAGFMQSTSSLVYVAGEGDDRISVEVLYFNEVVPERLPPSQPHEVVTIRGREGYLYESDSEGHPTRIYTLREGCRRLTVITYGEFAGTTALVEGMRLEPVTEE